MKHIKMKFKSFEFPVNPSVIKISADRSTEINKTVSGKSVSENASLNPVVISGEGEFFGEKAQEWCDCLHTLVKASSAGWLFTPSAAPVFAYFTEFSYSINAEKSSAQYSFKFIQADTKREEEKHFGFTYALPDENAFDIAYRTGVSVNEIMRLNDFKGPFDINEGDKVVLE